MSRLGRAAARTAARLNPRAWRGRYGAELDDLIDASDSTVGDAVDVVRAAFREHLAGGMQMQFGPATRRPRAFAVAATFVLLPTLGVVAFSIIGHELGFSAVARLIDPLLGAVGAVWPLDVALVVAPLVAFALAVLPLVDVRLETGAEATALTIALRVRALLANLAVAAISVLVGAALVWHILVESMLPG